MNERRRQGAELVITEYIASPPLAMYDLGVGICSEYLTLGEKYPDMRLFGCEPHPDEFRRLSEVFKGDLYCVGISDKIGSPVMYLAEVGNGGSTLFKQENTNKIPFNISTITLDLFDKWAGKPDRILLWMDIEGSELAALRGAPNLMSSGRVKWISAEVIGDPPKLPGYPSAAEIDDHLFRRGYVKVREHNHQGSHWDNIYVHESEYSGKTSQKET